MSKKRTPQQRSGRKGEDAFELWAADHRLLTNRPRDDYGFDFVCEVESASTGTSDITGDFIAVSVKSTTARAKRVRLNRDDAERLLSAKVVSLVAVVDLQSGTYEVYHRFLDEQFATELADFLASSNQHITLTPANCQPPASFDRNLEEALRGHFAERVRIAVARHRLTTELPSPHLEVRRTDHGELTLIEVPDFYSYFVAAGEPERGPHYEAIFGSPRRRLDRLASLGPRPAVLSHLDQMPNPILTGATEEFAFQGVAEGHVGRAAAPFTHVRTSTHTGWVHEGGFSITFSGRKREGDHWVHELEALIDEDEELALADHPALWEFLVCCTADAFIYPEDEPDRRIGVEWIGGMGRAHFFARYLRDATQLTGWHSVKAPLRVAKDDEALNTLALTAETAAHPQMFDRFGFVLLRPEEAHDRETRAQAEIPIVGNFGEHALVLWLAADVTLFVLGDLVHGVRIDRVRGTRVEQRDRAHKDTPYPEMVVDPTWPPVAITGSGHLQAMSDARSWGLEMILRDGDS